MGIDVLIGLFFLGLSIATRLLATRTRDRVESLEHQVAAQKMQITSLEVALRKLREGAARPGEGPVAATPSAAPPPKLETPPVLVGHTGAPVPPPAAGAPPPAAPGPPPIGDVAAPPIVIPPPIVAPPPVAPRVPPPPAPAPTPARAPLDWESLIGVRLFAAIAGISLVVGAVFFLLYSIDQGWLQPPVRVAIGIIVAISLLVVCELKAAQKYPATANALDAAAIAILFSTFFAAHALWNLIPSTAAFLLLALVTGVAVLLSIRRASLFIAVLGLLGGFLTPVLLSSGRNQPLALFSYLFLLNIGLAWVAYRKRWPILTALSAIFTTVYQWGWVVKFLQDSSLTLAMGIFLLFPAAALAGVVLGNSRRRTTQPGDAAFERTALIAAVVPLVFSLYLAAVPAYGSHAELLFGFLFIVDAGLLVVALGRSEHRLHVAGGLSTLLAVGLWLGTSYSPSAWTTAIVGVSLFVALYSLAPWIAARVERPLSATGLQATYTAPLLLFAFAVLAHTARGGASPLPLFATLFVLVGLIAWRAIAMPMGALYFVAAFFVLAAEAAWSDAHLMTESLSTALGLYAAFGIFALGVPVLARRFGRPLAPAQGSGIVLLAGLGLLLFLSLNPLAPAAIWGLAVLLAILNAALFIESAAGRMPVISIVGGLMSWAVLATWWWRAAAIVGLMPSLLFVVLLSLVMLAGHAWGHVLAERAVAQAPSPSRGQPIRFRDGLFLVLIGHLFLLFVAADPEWGRPPWPLFGATAVLTLAIAVVALFTRVMVLHVAGVAAGSGVVFAWSLVNAPGAAPLVPLLAGGAVSVFALLWLAASQRRTGGSAQAAIGAAIALFGGESIAIAVAEQPGAPGVVALIIAHAAGLSVILALAWRYRWNWVAPLAVAPAWTAVLNYQDRHPEPQSWLALLAFSGALYLVFTLYPFVLGRRARESRDPHLAAILASGFFLLAGRIAFIRGGYASYVGVIPVVEGLVLALLLRTLLRLEAPGARDAGRLALVAGAALAFVTVAIPLQLDRHWITLGWGLEGAALAWLCTKIPHRGLALATIGLLAAVFARLALNPAIFYYEPRGALRIWNWYLYTYAVCGLALILAGRWMSRTSLGKPFAAPLAGWIQAGGAVLLFLLLNIEIADYYAVGPEITFRFGVTVAQDLTYTIGWLLFGMAMLTAGILTQTHASRIAALILIAITTFKCFLYDLRTLEGLYRVGSFVGLAISLALVSLALQKYVLKPSTPKAAP